MLKKKCFIIHYLHHSKLRVSSKEKECLCRMLISSMFILMTSYFYYKQEWFSTKEGKRAEEQSNSLK